MQIKRIDGSYIDIPLSTEEEYNHFSEPRNYSKEIIEEWEIDPFKEIITKEDKIVIDVGCNVGLFAIHISPYARKIVCVEPTPEHMIVQKILLSKISIETFHEQSALNGYTGKARFRREGVNMTMNTLRDSPDSYEVDCITLKDLCEKYGLTHVDLVKIDIEGSEMMAITVETVKPVSHIVKKFLLETHPRSRECQDHFKKIFEECGYWAEYFDFNGSVIAYK